MLNPVDPDLTKQDGSTFRSRGKLIHRANQVAAFFGRAMRHDEAVAGVAEHFNSYWEPRLRRQLLAVVVSNEGALARLIVEAAAAIRIPPMRG